ncbi:LysR family transcriptional regulator [Promicromonospora panici]|uniref:LysR family transcriptional regulator n=1 Tax=Promicromonospora panici TaxID=2219658 RepID=UPI00101D98B8|nr:LysR family transcriptional regulator [Promicromonospora panici]
MDLLKHLGFFRAVAESRHFGNAAADLGMTQPPLSQGIRRLERRLGTRLFDRDARGVRITAAGRRLLPAARDLLDAADDLVATARDLALPEHVRLGVAADLEDGVPGLLRALSADGTSVVPTVAGSVEVVDLLRDGLLDVGLVRHPGVLDGLIAGPVLLVPTRLAGGPVARVPAGLPDVGLPVAVPPRHHQPPAHDQLVDALRRAGHSGEVVEARDVMQRRALVAAGAAVGIVPVVADEADAEERPAGPGAGSGPGAAAVSCPPLRLRVALPHAAQRRPEVDHDAVAAAIGAALGTVPGGGTGPVG